MKDKYRHKFGALMALLVLAAFALTGCSGSAGPAGPQGTTGATGPAGNPVVNPAALTAEQAETFTMTGTVTSVTIASPPVVKFWLKDASGSGIINMGTKNAAGTALNNLRFALAKLVPGTNGSPDQWVSYMVTNTSRPTTENNGTLVDNGDGSYTYTFTTDVTDVTKTGGVTYEPNLTHRLAIQCSGTLPGSTSTIYNPANITYDFIPATGKPVGAADTRREIVSIAACNECHGKLALHGGGRIDTKLCVVCHTDQRRIGQTASTEAGGIFTSPVATSGSQAGKVVTYITDGQAVGNFVNMIHKIHMGNKLTKQNYNFAGVAFNAIGFPQDQTNCRKCHKGDTEAQLAVTPQGNNWKTKPSRLACGACHDGIDFATGTGTTVKGATTGHIGGARADDAFCILCHDPLSIETKHMTPNATPNNPSVPAGAVNFTYEINSLTVNAGNQAVVKFRILKDGTAVAFNGSGANPLTGFTGSPGFLVAFADGTDTAVDYNNKGNLVAAAQPVTVSIADLLPSAASPKGTLGTPGADGYYTATIGTATYTAANFPAGAKMRAVALQGYFTQAAGTNGLAAATARHAIAAWKGAAGDTIRREVVDSDKCSQCHEWFEGHGGSRVKTVMVCIMCHNGNFTSSGRGVTVANLAPAEAAKLTAAGYDATNPLTFPEKSMHFKNLIHGIHASHARTTKFDFVRDRNGGLYYDFSHVTFPGILKNCETCHKPGTYGVNLPAGALWSTTRITADINGDGTGQDTSPATVKTMRATVNPTDRVTSPIAATCIACHDGALPRAHILASGGLIDVARGGAINGEQCLLCHGPDKVADVKVMHAK